MRCQRQGPSEKEVTDNAFELLVPRNFYNYRHQHTSPHQQGRKSTVHTANFLRFEAGLSISSAAVAGTGAALRFELIFEIWAVAGGSQGSVGKMRPGTRRIRIPSTIEA